jgi:hypothetical protein
VNADELAVHERELLDAEPLYAGDPESAREIRAAIADVRTMLAELREGEVPRRGLVARLRRALGRVRGGPFSM